MQLKNLIRLVTFIFLAYLFIFGILISFNKITGVYFWAAVVIEALLICVWGYLFIKLARSAKKKSRVKSVQEIIKGIDKEFNFYCPSCLFQSNTKFNICPKCKNGKAVKTGRGK